MWGYASGRVTLLIPLVAGAATLLYGSLAAWFGLRGRMGRSGFYLVFACAVTLSVQLVGLYLVFATLIVPALLEA